MKKVLAIMFALTLLVSLLAGCGSTATDSQDAAAESTPAADAAAEKLPLCGTGIHSWNRPGGGGEARPALHLGPLPAGTAGAGHSRSCDLRCGILHYKRTR